MSVLVIGGGITGLTLALALHRAGIPCRVYEAASTIRRLGVGINLQPHGVRALSGLGLEDALAKVAVATSEMGFLQSLRATHLYRAARPGGRLRLAAILGASR